MSAIIRNLFVVTVLMELVYAALFVLTIRLPGFRFWPPPQARSWQFFSAWLAAGWVVINFLVLGILDFDSLILWPLRQRLPFALAILAVGASIGTWAWAVFGLSNVIGMAGGLVTSGPYRYSRNPQYIGDSLNIQGFVNVNAGLFFFSQRLSV